VTLSKHEGRLELTWTNKHLRLLAYDDGSYEWVSPSDYRVAEVRLLRDVVRVGETQPNRVRARDNLLIRGDALNALSSLLELPEFAREYAGQVKLAYLDPPFNTQQSFLQYDDALEHSVWLTMMRDRLVQVREMLGPDGSVWVHCDDSEQHRLRCVLDEVFGPANFIATVIWQKTTSGRNDAEFFSTDQDYILVYARDRGSLRFNRLASTEAASKAYKNPDGDPRGGVRLTTKALRPLKSDLTCSTPSATRAQAKKSGLDESAFGPTVQRNTGATSRRTFSGGEGLGTIDTQNLRNSSVRESDPWCLEPYGVRPRQTRPVARRMRLSAFSLT